MATHAEARKPSARTDGERHTPFMSYLGVGIGLAMLIAMMFLQASAGTNL
jgi:hypothetical protein